MLKAFFPVLLLLVTHAAVAQLPVDSISEAEVSRMLHYLASDSMKGRGNHTPELHTAAHFIEQKFREAGLKEVLSSFLQPFTTKRLAASERLNDTAGWDDPKTVLLNVVGMLPGRSPSGEIILFCAHYDHVGVKGSGRRTIVYNGANDNASGTVGLLALAAYFAKRADNERTLLFCAFAGEELGLLGSTYFVQSFGTISIKAVINIEMIGRSDVAGKKGVFITGANESDFASIFKRNTKGHIKISPEPAAEKGLFQRSDNYPFALKGIPAHTIMSSDDSDGCYHKDCDEVERIDIKNMTAIIRAIAAGSRTLIDGTDTPVLNR
jgi:acetylornithine deacetylase/succinyl-diaminopimelate desuccinylase-like protein